VENQTEAKTCEAQPRSRTQCIACMQERRRGNTSWSETAAVMRIVVPHKSKASSSLRPDGRQGSPAGSLVGQEGIILGDHPPQASRGASADGSEKTPGAGSTAFSPSAAPPTPIRARQHRKQDTVSRNWRQAPTAAVSPGHFRANWATLGWTGSCAHSGVRAPSLAESGRRGYPRI
jgi:hypothetical protein